MGGTNSPAVTLADVKNAIDGLKTTVTNGLTDLGTTVTTETGEVTAQIKALLDKLNQNGTQVTAADLQDLLTRTQGVQQAFTDGVTSIKTQIQAISEKDGGNTGTQTPPPPPPGQPQP